MIVFLQGLGSPQQLITEGYGSQNSPGITTTSSLITQGLGASPRIFTQGYGFGTLPPTVMSAVNAALIGAVGSLFGDSLLTPKFHSDTGDPGVDLPYALHSAPDYTTKRFMTGAIEYGTFELGVFDVSADAANAKLRAAVAALEAMSLPQPLGDGGFLYRVKGQSGQPRVIDTPAPGSGIVEFGRARKIDYQLNEA